MCALSSHMPVPWPTHPINQRVQFMRANRIAALAMLLLGVRFLSAQVVASVEISDTALRNLQQQSFNDLKTVGKGITSYPFAFPFYLSRTLDIDERAQKRTDQHSIRFEH